MNRFHVLLLLVLVSVPPADLTGEVLNLYPETAFFSGPSLSPRVRSYRRKGLPMIGYWQRLEENVSWIVRPSKGKDYAAFLYLSCPRHAAGSLMRLSAGTSSLTFKVPSTPSWDTFVCHRIPGLLRPGSGPVRVKLQIVSKKGKDVLLVRGLILVPAGTGNSGKAALLRARFEDKRRSGALSLIRQGSDLEAKGRKSEALTVYLRAARSAYASAEAWFRAGMISRKMKRFEDAARYLQKARALQPDTARYAFSLAVLLKRPLARYKEAPAVIAPFVDVLYPAGVRLRALSELADAWMLLGNRRRYLEMALAHERETLRAAPAEKDKNTRALLLYRTAMILRRSAEWKRAMRYFGTAADLYRTAAAGGRSPQTQAGAWAGCGRCRYRQYRIRESYEAYLRALRIHSGSMGWGDRYKFREAAFYMATESLIAGRDRAAEQYVATGHKYHASDDFKYKLMRDVAREYRLYRDRVPMVDHRVVFVVVRHTEAERTMKDGSRVRVEDTVPEYRIRKLDITGKLLAMAYRVLSRGRVRFVTRTVVHEGTIRALDFYGFDKMSVTGGFSRLIFSLRDRFDTFVYFWASGLHANLPTGGSGTLTFVPYSYWKTWRGGAQLAARWTGWDSLYLLAHEMWHVMESLVPMSPVHGWGGKPLLKTRRKYPDWKGRGEWSLYRYHFGKTMPQYIRSLARKKGWTLRRAYQQFRHSLRSPSGFDREPPAFETLRKKIAAIPNGKLGRSRELRRRGNEQRGKRNYREALRLYREADRLNPYNLKLLENMAWLYGRMDMRRERLSILDRRLKLYPTFAGYQKYVGELEKAGRKNDALETLNRAWKWSGDNGFLGLLARKCAQYGNIARARRYWKLLSSHVVRQTGKDIFLFGKDARIVSSRPIPVLRPWARAGKFELGYWVVRGEYLSWNLEVNRPGRYRVKIESAGPKAVAGNPVVLSVGSRHVRFPVTVSWNPERHDTGKNVYLVQGRVRVILKSADPGRAVGINFRCIVLERIGE